MSSHRSQPRRSLSTQGQVRGVAAVLLLLAVVCSLAASVEPARGDEPTGAAGSSSTSGFDPDPGRAPEPVERPADDKAASDAWYAALAEATGSTLEEAIERTRLQSEVDALREHLRTTYSDTFGGLWITTTPPFEVHVAFTDTRDSVGLDETALRLGLSDSTALRVREVKYSLQTLIAAYDALAHTLATGDASLDSDRLGASVNVVENVVDVRHPDPAAEALVRSAGPSDAIRFSVGDGRAGDDLVARGGQRTSSGCTTGFVIRKNSSIEAGQTTAAHCGDTPRLFGVSSPEFGPALRSTNDGVDTDVQWMSLAERDWAPTNRVQWNHNGDELTIRGRVNYWNIGIGDFLCKYGWRTGNSCGFVESTVCCGSGQRFVSVDRNMTRLPGDSGGPVYEEQATPEFYAVGLHKGPTNELKAYFSAISWFESDWGVKVATSSLPTPAYEWFVRNSNTTGFSHYEWEWAESGSEPVVGVWGSWTDDDRPGFFRNGVWDLEGKSRTTFGTSSDHPVVGDWDNDGIDERGYFRPSSATFFRSGTFSISFGNPSDTPISGDWDGNGYDDVGIWRPSEAKFYLRNGDGSVTEFFYGDFNDLPVVGDWDDDGTDEVGVYRPSTAWWYLQGVTPFEYGNPYDTPLPGDWDGNGRDTVGVVR